MSLMLPTFKVMVCVSVCVCVLSSRCTNGGLSHSPREPTAVGRAPQFIQKAIRSLKPLTHLNFIEFCSCSFLTHAGVDVG